MAKSANGMGTIRKRPDGRWEGRYTAPDGRQRSVYGHTKSECTDKLRNRPNDRHTDDETGQEAQTRAPLV